MNTWGLLDNTMLTNFALLNRPDLVLDLLLAALIQSGYRALITSLDAFCQTP